MPPFSEEELQHIERILREEHKAVYIGPINVRQVLLRLIAEVRHLRQQAEEADGRLK